MYSQDYMKNYYLKHKEKIKKQSMEWREKNINRVKAIQKNYREKHGIAVRDYKEEKIKELPFKERVSPEILAKLKYNSRINKLYIKHYPWEENRFIIEVKKKILEGV